MADTTQSAAFPLASEGYSGDSGGSSSVDDAGGASGASSSDLSISRGAMVAIIVVVVVVAVLGITSAILFYLAKKREWKIRESIRRSARKVVTALTPRRSEFPRSAKEGRPASRGRVRLDDVPPTPRLPKDLEKGLSQPSQPGNKSIKIKLSTFSRK
ncbi:hypothetical protein F503_05489 [Ophiostoma piceae UAMH 11346]|uniref:Uncharacterized protein n=1 Tax=Ophiostoma piceae (strain UAMH 11346) TaxID=1262450 RepID=S3CA34_OPHP1|nr:hypothetical protein F503_05489 [Ophiostoma piceae UAMH 11346]